MIARKLSLAGAVALVGVGLLANAGVQWATATQNVASADDRDPGRVESPSAAPMVLGGMVDTLQSMHMGSDGRCDEEAPVDWFGDVRALPNCGWVAYGLPTQDGRFADVNADGIVEYFEEFPDNYGPIVAGGVPQPNRGFLFRIESRFVGSSVSVAAVPVIETDRLAKWILAFGGWQGNIYCDKPGWIDLDEDGDLDLVVRFYGDGGNRQFAWLENTGFEATQPLAGDLNADRNVDSADLTILLGGWTGS
jgi:hypothetical protein